MPHNGPASHGEKDTRVPRREVLAQAHSARSGGAKPLISVSWTLSILSLEDKAPKGATIQPIIAVSGVNKWVSLGPTGVIDHQARREADTVFLLLPCDMARTSTNPKPWSSHVVRITLCR